MLPKQGTTRQSRGGSLGGLGTRRVIGPVGPALAAAVVAASLTACGGGAPRSSRTPSTVSATSSITGSLSSSSQDSSAPGSGGASGRQVFAQACEVCHSISGHSRPSQQGGDLRMFHSSLAQLRQLTAEMPVLHHHRLSSAELSAVVAYVAAIENRN